MMFLKSIIEVGVFDAQWKRFKNSPFLPSDFSMNSSCHSSILEQLKLDPDELKSTRPQFFLVSQQEENKKKTNLLTLINKQTTFYPQPLKNVRRRSSSARH